MGEPATEMDSMDSAKASRGLGLGLKKAMASDKILLRRPGVLAWKHLYRYTAGCHQHIDEMTPGCWFLTGQDLLHWEQVI